MAYKSLFLSLIFISMAGLSCKKKDRLSVSTFQFGITPPAASVLPTQTLTLSAYGTEGVAVSPTWAVSPTGVGTLSNSLGTSVVFTPVALGTAVVTATFEGLQATSQLNVVTYIPGSGVFNVYNDDGLPSTSGSSRSDIFVSGLSLSEQTNNGYSPEGVQYQRASGAGTGTFWGITLDADNVGLGRDLTSYDGSIKFSLRLVNRTLSSIAGGDHIQIQLKTYGASSVSVSLASGSYGFNRLSTDWQQITIPIADFVGLDTTLIQNPFAIVAVALTSDLSFDIDAIRWEP